MPFIIIDANIISRIRRVDANCPLFDFSLQHIILTVLVTNFNIEKHLAILLMIALPLCGKKIR
uniref:Uncharacterized protein n=1 Tax=Candidatus Kentrum sp. MB TaxID=2138164 RepID=A0A450XAW1_9GAMM|nr:MAG: hypothetical protein BECKMB1821G_GA0114241_102126 [Candidatus Kentron sp. MB]VFK30371.1 MAG: hypothetical protein BECKMB1821I_GA0114274_101522 [Candidatus Kentron sp. MB]VFK75190.1 MAG: hypothetical protein BECKMB1821H_GA0114242_101722 [Candidatus Kentron sp. MB]